MSDPVLAAGIIAFPANLGSTMCLQAVQVYINRTVPQDQQGGIFGLQQVQENALNLIVILLLGGLATIIGPQYIFFFAPIVVGAAGPGVDRLQLPAFHRQDAAPVGKHRVPHRGCSAAGDSRCQRQEEISA